MSVRNVCHACRSSRPPLADAPERKRPPRRRRRLPAPAAARTITRLDPALDALVPADAVVEKVAGGFQFTEGPLWRPSEGRLWFSDVVGNVLRAVTPTGEVRC